MTNYKHITRRASYNLARFMQTGNIDEKSRPEEVSHCHGSDQIWPTLSSTMHRLHTTQDRNRKRAVTCRTLHSRGDLEPGHFARDCASGDGHHVQGGH